MPNNNFPKFPSQFTPEDEERIEELKRLAQEQRRIYKTHYAPSAWKKKPFIERAIRRVGEKAYAPPEWLRGITPWEEYGLTPEQADIYIRETEGEIQELKRLQRVAGRAPLIKEALTIVAQQYAISGDEAELYELIKELNPDAPFIDRLPVTEEERQWFIDFYKSLAGKSKEEVDELYLEEFPAPKTLTELMDLIKVTVPNIEPRFVLSTVAFSKDIEAIGQALQLAYPPQTEKTPEEVRQDDIVTELEKRGIEPTGDWKEDIKKLLGASSEEQKEKGIPTQITLDDGTSLAVDVKEDGYYSDGVKIANIDPDTGGVVPLTPGEEFELDWGRKSKRPGFEVTAQETLETFCPRLSNRQYDEFWATDGSKEQMEAWCKKYVNEDIKPLWIDKFTLLRTGDYPSPDANTEVQLAFTAGIGKVLTAVGGASKWLGAGGVADSLREEGARLEKSMPQVADLSDFHWTNMFNPRYWSTPEFKAVLLHGVATVPFCLSLLPAAMLAWWGGTYVAGAIAVKMVLGAFGTKVLIMAVGGAAAGTVSRALESLMEAGSSFDMILDMDGTADEGGEIAGTIFWDNMKLAGLDAVEIIAALAPLPPTIKVFGRAINKGLFRIARIGGRMTIVGLTQAGEEYYQTGVERRAMGEEDPWRFDPEAQLATVLGGMMGLGMGAGGDFLSGIINRTEEDMTPEQKETFDKDVGELGEKEALDKFAETPKGAEIVEDAVEVVKEQFLNKEIKDPKKRVHVEEDRVLKKKLPTVEPEQAEEIQKKIKELKVTPEAVTAKIEALGKTLTQVNADIEVFTSSLTAQEAKLKEMKAAKALPSEQMAQVGTVTDLKTNLKESKARGVDLAKRIKKLEKSLVEPVAPEAATEDLWNDLKGEYNLDFTFKFGEGEAGRGFTDFKTKEIVLPYAVKMKGANFQSAYLIHEVTHAILGSKVHNMVFLNLEKKLLSDYNLKGIHRYDKGIAIIKEVAAPEAGMPEAPVVVTKNLNKEEILDGKGVNVKEREAQAAVSNDPNLRKMSPEELTLAREAAVLHLAELSEIVDINIPLQKAFGTAWKLGSIPEYVKDLPEEFTVAQEFIDGEFNESDTPMWNLQIQPAIDCFAVIDNGRDTGLARRHVQLVGEYASLAQQNIQQGWAHMYKSIKEAAGLHKIPLSIRKGKDWENNLYSVIQEVGSEDIGMTAGDLMERKEIQALVGGYPKGVQWSMVDFAQSLRMFLDGVLTDMNSVRAKLGRELIPHIDKYLPWIYEVNIWGNLMGFHLKPDFIMETASMPDFIKPSAPFNPRALSRKCGMGAYEKVKDIDKLVITYLGVATREMFFTPVVLNTKAHVKVLREKGHEVPARWIENWALERYAGVPNAWNRAWNDYIPQFVTRPIAALNRSLTRAVFALNFQWNLIVQPSSTAMSCLRYGIPKTILGLQALWNPAAHKITQNSWSYIHKSRGMGSLVYQDLGTVNYEAQRLLKGKLDTVTDYLNFFTRWMELKLTEVSIYTAHLDGKAKGLTGNALQTYAADGGAKVQSMYDPYHTPGAIQTPMFQYLVRFQTFSFEALTRVREMANVKHLPKAGAYQSVAANTIEGQALIQNRVKKFLQFFATIWAINIIGDLAIDRKPWEVSSFLPAASVMMLGVEPHRAWNLPIPMRWSWELWKGFSGLVEYGNWKPITEWALRWNLPAGIAASRTLQGIIAVIDEGKVTDIAGEVMYELEPDEYIRAIIMGPWQTATGREYRERMFEGADKTTNRILKELEEKEGQLGEDVEGEYYTFKSFLSDANGILVSGEEGRLNHIEELMGEPSMEWTGEPQWLVLDDAMGFSELTRFAVYCDKFLWEEYKEIPTDQRINYRKSHPYVDATLYFWEQVRTLRSRKAKEVLEEVFEQFKVGDNPRMHWKGLPRVPDWVDLLPE